MQVQQIVRASADVLTITRLAPGNVYKRVDDTSYTGTPVIKFGVVQDVMNNGEDSAVSALEFTADYSDGVKVAPMVFTGSKPAAIFPAQPEELAVHFDELERSANAALERAQAALDKATGAVAAVVRVRGQVGELTAADTSTVAGELVDGATS